jgi:hypothetical protein
MGTVMVTVFWDADAVIHMDFFDPGTTINSECYIATLKSSEAQEEHFAAI